MPARRRFSAIVLCAALAAAVANAAPPVAQQEAKQILAATAVQGGLVVHLGCGDGRLTAALRTDERYLVHGLDADIGNVDVARKYIQSLGCYGPVSVEHWADTARLPYAENLINLLVAEDLGKLAMTEVLRALAPRGVAYVKQNGRWTKVVKPWPQEVDEWTHWLHGPDGNAVAHDRVAGPPRRLQWIAGPSWSRHHNTPPSVSSQVSAKGRLFYIVDEAPAGMDGSAPDQWSLVARDAFNGVVLWQKPIPQWGWKSWSADYTCRFTVPTQLPSRLVAAGDRVFVTLGFNAPLSELDAATGQLQRTFEGSDGTDEILFEQEKLTVSLSQAPQQPGPPVKKKQGPSVPPVRKSVAMFDAHTGKLLWKTGDYVGLQSKTGSMEPINHLCLVSGGGQVFFVDRDHLVSLSCDDGSERWRASRPQVPEHKMRYDIRLTDMVTLVYHDGVLLFAQLDPDRRIDWREVRGKIHAFDAGSGRELWNRPCASWGWGHPADVFVHEDLVWVQDFKQDFLRGLDLRSGVEKRSLSNFDAFDNGHHHRCYRNKATDRFVMTSYRGYEFVDWQSGQTSLNHWVRGTCRLGGFPCNGLVYSNPHPCECYINTKLNGMLALSPAEPSLPKTVVECLVKGPAYSATADARGSTINVEDWPMFRHDPQRSGAAGCTVRADWSKKWETALGTAPTACVAAGDWVYTACPESHEVCALRAGDGPLAWRFTAGGRVDTPPTLHGGRLYFGSADGWVYCLRANDGALAWRFRAAPEDRWVGAFGRIESAWPVHGSLLIRDDVVYIAAGRSSFLDGGVCLYTLDVSSGRVLSEQRIASDHDAKVGIHGGDVGLLSDLLVCHDDSIFMRQNRLFTGTALAALPKTIESLYATGGLLDDSWFSRTRWFLDGSAYGEFLVFDTERVYGVRARPARSSDQGFFSPGAEGYELFASSRKQHGKPEGKSADRAAPRSLWSVRVPVRINAMVLAGDTLFAAGTPDAIEEQEPWAAYEGMRGGVLLALDPTTGEVRKRLELDAAPVYDGLSAAAGRLYLATRQGRLICAE